MNMRRGDVVGPFMIDRPLSEDGGMSQVFLARDAERQQCKVALKVTLTEDENSHAFQDLLRQEANLLTSLRHPGIVRIYPLWLTRVTYVAKADAHINQPWYFAMEYLEGNSLEYHLKDISNARKFSMLWGIELFYQMLTTVHFMHEQGYAHCDLKPQNILFREPPDPKRAPAPVLIDFGSAGPLDGVERPSATPRYAPPEVLLALDRKDIPLRQLPADKIDIWGLGLLLFELMTGRPLFNQRRKAEVTTTILRRNIEPMSKHRPDIHPSLDKLLDKMLQKNPTKRPSTAQVVEALEERIQSVRPPRIGG